MRFLTSKGAGNGIAGEIWIMASIVLMISDGTQRRLLQR